MALVNYAQELRRSGANIACMATSNRGMNPLDTLRDRYEAVETECPACGYDDAEGTWVSQTDGAEVRYEHDCPSCGKVTAHTISFGR